MKLLRFASAMALVLALGLVLPQAASAAPAPSTGLEPGCLIHDVTVTVGTQIELDSSIDNECNPTGSLTITYRADGPCRHKLSFSLNLPSGPFDIVSFLDSSCAGHYVLSQKLSSHGQRLGTDVVEFDVPEA